MERALTYTALGLSLLGLVSPRSVPAQAVDPGSPSSRVQAGTSAHRLVIAAGSCWLGGVWSDAQGATETERSDASKKRCHEVIKAAYGSDDEGRFERLRAVDAVEVSDFGNKVDTAARADRLDAAHTQELRGLLNATANAEREAIALRRAADKVKDAIAVPKPSQQRKNEETAAAAALSETQQWDALMAANVGSLTPELRAFGLLFAMDRMQVARGLPKHLKVLAVRGPLATVFGVPAPDMPPDATRPPAGGAWLAYLTSTAQAAGHPVPAQAKSLHDKELLAWGGTLMGFADKLRLQAEHITNQTDLRQVVDAVVRRLETEYRADESAMLTALRK
jgi:hypothetical protein